MVSTSKRRREPPNRIKELYARSLAKASNSETRDFRIDGGDGNVLPMKGSYKQWQSVIERAYSYTDITRSAGRIGRLALPPLREKFGRQNVNNVLKGVGGVAGLGVGVTGAVYGAAQYGSDLLEYGSNQLYGQSRGIDNEFGGKARSGTNINLAAMETMRYLEDVYGIPPQSLPHEGDTLGSITARASIAGLARHGADLAEAGIEAVTYGDIAPLLMKVAKETVSHAWTTAGAQVLADKYENVPGVDALHTLAQEGNYWIHSSGVGRTAESGISVIKDPRKSEAEWVEHLFKEGRAAANDVEADSWTQWQQIKNLIP